jgi:hypothetical protein
LADLEGYLMAHAGVLDARTRAEAFADALPWLTAAEREEIIRLYTDDDIVRTRRAWETVAQRAQELREEYAVRYAELRWRLLRRGVVSWLSAAAVLMALWTLSSLYRHP